MNGKKLNRRQDEKSLRAADKAALRGDHHRQPPNDRWNHRPVRSVLMDAPCNGKDRGKKKRKQKERCPVNRVHEWYKEDVTTENVVKIDGYYCWLSSPGYTVTTSYRLSTCIHCWTEKKTRVRRSYKRGR